MHKEYDTFVNQLSDLVKGNEIELTIRDLSPGKHKYESRYVKANIAPSFDQLPQGDLLWVRFPMGVMHPSPFAIEIKDELGEYRP